MFSKFKIISWVVLLIGSGAILRAEVPTSPKPADCESVALLDATLKGFNALSADDQNELVKNAAPNDATRNRMANSFATNSLPVKLSWSGTSGLSQVYVMRLSDGQTVWSGSTTNSSIRAKGLEVGRTYQWTVQNGSDVASWRFQTEPDAPRIIAKDYGGIENCRDIGGWTNVSGQVVKQGMIYRSEKFDSLSSSYRELWTDTFGIKLDIDLRHTTEVNGMGTVSPLGSSVRRFCPWQFLGEKDSDKFGSYGRLFENDDFNEPFRAVFLNLIDRTRYPVITHCTYGRDRTGSLVFMLNGILGVPFDDLRSDYFYTMVSKASDLGDKDSAGQVTPLWITTMVEDMRAKYPDTDYPTDLSKFEAYFHDCGITDDQIATFRSIMLEDPESAPVASKKTAVVVPAVPDRRYTGETLKALVAPSDFYSVSSNVGGVDVGTYTVKLSLVSGAKWADGSTASKTLSYRILPAVNSWTTAPSIKDFYTTDTTVSYSKGKSAFGTVSSNYNTTDLLNLSAGTYELICKVEPNENYKGLEKKITFQVIDPAAVGREYRLVQLNAVWDDSNVWSNKLEGGSWPHLTKDVAYVPSDLAGSATLDLQGGAYSIHQLVVTSTNGVTIKNGTIEGQSKTNSDIKGSVTFRDMTLKGGDLAAAKEKTTIRFEGANTVSMPCVYRGNATAFEFVSGKTTLEKGFVSHSITSAHRVRLVSSGGLVDVTGDFAVKSPVDVAVTIPASFDEVQAAPLKFTGEFKVIEGSTLWVDVSAKSSGTYRVLEAGSITGDFAEVQAVASAGHYARVTCAESLVTVTVYEGEDPNPPHKHAYSAWTTNAPTCTAAGSRTRTCQNTTGTCDEPTQTETIAALGHDWYLKSETSTQLTYACTRCTETYTETREPEPLPSDLPATYTPLSYISATGAQWLNTGISAGPGLVVQLDVKAKPAASGSNAILAAYESGKEAYLPCVDNNGFYLVGVGNSGDRQTVSVSAAVSNRVEIALDESCDFTIKYNGKQVAAKSTRATPTSQPLYLFARNDVSKNAVDKMISADLYLAKIYTNGNRLARYYLPCREKATQAIGLYDLKNGTFSPSASGTSFAAPGEEPSVPPPAHEHSWFISQETDTEIVYACSGCGETYTEKKSPPVGPAGYYQAVASGNWQSAANWQGPQGGTYPAQADDVAVIPNTFASPLTLDLQGATISIQAFTNLSTCGVLIQNGTLQTRGYIENGAAGEVTFKNVNFKTTATSTSAAYVRLYKEGASYNFEGNCNLNGRWLRASKDQLQFRFTDGVTTAGGLSLGTTPGNTLMLNFNNARLSLQEMNGSFPLLFNIILGSRHSSAEAVLALTKTLTLEASSHLEVDARQVGVGRYLLISAGTLSVKDANFVSNANVTCAKGHYGLVTKTDNQIWLEVLEGIQPRPLELSRFFQSKMVFQHSRPIKVWGKVTEGERVTVQFGSGATVTSTAADESGIWEATLPAESISKVGQTLTVRHGEEVIVLNDILVGNVWLCGGQSNMATKTDMTYNFEDFIPDSSDLVRYICLKTQTSDQPEPYKISSRSTWYTQVEAATNMAATPFFFGRAMHLAQPDVPIGLVDNSVGGRCIECFISPHILADDASLSNKVAAFNWSGTKAFDQWNPMYEPLTRATFCGFIFAQGCSNYDNYGTVGTYEQYLKLFFRGVRQVWGENLPIYNMQLASMDNWSPTPDTPIGREAVLPAIRQAQLNVFRSMPNMGLVTLADLYSTHYHPGAKVVLGNRFARWARRDMFGEAIQACGPIAVRAIYSNDVCRVKFDAETCGQGLVVGYKRWNDNAEPVTAASLGITTNINGFALSADKSHWYWADATIESKNYIRLHCSEVKNPRYVRFAYTCSPCGWNKIDEENAKLAGPGINLYAQTLDGVLLLASPFDCLTAVATDGEDDPVTPPTPIVCDHHVVNYPSVKPTCTTVGYSGGSYCDKCQTVLVPRTEIPALGHNWNEWIVTKEATKTETGLRTRTCKNCTVQETQVIPIDGEWPTGYTRLKYVYSTEGGKQYFKTGIIGKPNMVVTAKFTVANPQVNYVSLLGSATSAVRFDPLYLRSGVFAIGNGKTYSFNTARCGNGTLYEATVCLTSSASDSTLTLKSDAGESLYRVSEVPSSAISGSSDLPIEGTGLELYCFGRNVNGELQDYSSCVGRLYGMTIQVEGVLVANYVPCLNDNQVAGFYDLVSHSFKESASAVAFLGGPVAEDPVGPVYPPAADVTGVYHLVQGGAWADAANWTGVTDGTYPHLADDSALIPSSFTGSATIDLAGKSYTLKSLQGTDEVIKGDVTIKNGAITVSEASYLKINAAKTLTFENVALTSTVTATDSANEYKKCSIDPYVTGATVAFKGTNTVSGFWLRNYKSITYTFTDGITEIKKGFSFGLPSVFQPFSMKLTNARFKTPALELPADSVAIQMVLGENNRSNEAVLTLTGAFKPTAKSTLSVDATALPEGTYPLIQAGAFTDAANFASVTPQVASGLVGRLSLANNTLNLTITKAGEDTPTIDPAQNQLEVSGVRADSQRAACDAVKIQAPAGIDNPEYATYFTLTAQETAPGVYTVSAELNQEAIALEYSLATLCEGLVAGGTEGTVEISAKRGLYYAVKKSASLTALKNAAPSSWQQAKSNRVSLDISLSAGASSGFYKIVVSPVGAAQNDLR